ncbi:hypothetical protein Dimus_005591 [Dionaea muscipula]
MSDGDDAHEGQETAECDGCEAASGRRPREPAYDSSSPVRRPVLFHGSPSPRPPGYRRAPPSPGLRPRSQRSPSPMIFSSSDPDEFSSSEEREASEAAVTSSEAEDRSDVEDGVLASSLVLDLSPILEDVGKQGNSSSSISRSSILSPSAAILYCQAAMDSGGQDLVSSLSHLAADFSGDFGC